MRAILSICEQYNIPVVEDAAEALGANYCGSPAGSMGAYSFFSFNGNKIITTSGGGMLLSNDGEGIEQAFAQDHEHRCKKRYFAVLNPDFS